MNDSERQFLSEPNSAIVATVDDDGLPVQSVVWYVPDGDGLWFSTRPSSVKVRHLRREPRLSVLIIGPGGGSYVRLEGRAEMVEEVGDAARLELITRYVGPDDAPAWIAAHPLAGPNQLVRIRPDRVVSYGL